jgi:hypothetical protein
LKGWASGLEIKMKWFKSIPWFYICFAIFPLLFLWAANASQVDSSVVLRPMLITLGGSALLFLILFVIFRDVSKAAWIGTLILFLFFTYGHVYDVLRHSTVLAILGRHRFLVPVYLVALGLGIWAILAQIKKPANFFHWPNIFGLLLVIMSGVQLGYFYIASASAARQSASSQTDVKLVSNRKNLPDVYFIVLDMYMRSDALQAEMGFDNSAFIDQLQNLGFYVAKCSRSNYGYTTGSVSSTLNMNYLPAIEASTGLQANNDSFHVTIKNAEVRRQLEAIGYKTAAFRNEYPWLEMTDADVFLGLDRPSIGSKYLYPFENMYINSTAAVLWNSADSKFNLSRFFSKPSSTQVSPVPIPSNMDIYFQNHIDVTFFTLEKLSEISSMAGPKFVYAHFLVPHDPHVFGPNGTIQTDPTYFSGDAADTIGTAVNKQGYLYGVQFINGQIVPVLRDIISNSKTPPIIVLEGDHGYTDNEPGHYTNLEAYYLPDGYAHLYPSITPVNSFRMIFDDYFGAKYPLLPDTSYGNGGTVPETFLDCLP